MPLFQKNVFRTYWERTRALPACQDAYKRLMAHFGDAKIQKNILASKEEQYQEGFLRDLFVDILGYTLAPQPDYNLTTELKNPNSSQKVDGAIVDGEQVKAVIELKSAKTTDLHGVMAQAFKYKNSHKGCKYVLTSNFTRLRFYIEDNQDFLEFDLFKMTEEAFAQLYTVLHKDSILKDLPAKIKTDSTSREEALTKQFYEDYQAQRDILFANIMVLNNNNGRSSHLLLSTTQKLLDRLIFMCFAEDKRLLPPNLTTQIVKNWKVLVEMEGEMPLYDRFKKYFNYLNKGNRGKPHDIFGYNGGLFAPDATLDNLAIQDTVLEAVIEKLSIYDFDSDIDVNVLGHIFEHSLSVLNEQKSILSKGRTDVSSVSLRKKDGVFYTPRYITRYMVANSIGKMCEAKKESLGLLEIDFDEEGKRKTIESAIVSYENWLQTVRVLDPACGSGAFLNQVLEFFIREYEWIESVKKYLAPPKDDFMAPLVEENKNYIHQILENNIFGVDINFDSVQITKLSLWLRTAQHRIKLNNLNGNIKQGNSLVDAKQLYIKDKDGKDVLYEKSFDWEGEFPQVFANGGKFDLIIGNPPYVRQETLEEWEKEYFKKRYKNMGSGVADLYVYFYAKALEMLKPEGTLAYITPNKWFKTKYGEGLRKTLQPLEIQYIVDFFENRVFEDASTEPQIIVLKNKVSNQDFDYFPITEELVGKVGLENFAEHLPERLIVEKKNLEESEWVFTTGEKQHILDTTAGKKGLPTVSLKAYSQNGIYYGIKTGLNKAFIIDRATKEELIKKDVKSADLIKPYIQSTDIKKWHLEGKEESYFINTGYDTEISGKKYKAIYEYLKQFEKELKARQDKGKTAYNLRACDYYNEFDKPKLMYIRTALEHQFYYDTEKYCVNDSCYIISNADLFLCAFLNSPIFRFYKKFKFVAFGNPEEGGRSKLDANKMVNVPVPVLLPAQKQPIEQKVEELRVLADKLHEKSRLFLKFVKAEFKLEKINGGLGKWQEIGLDKFFSEIKNQKGTMTAQQKMDFTPIFEKTQKEAQALVLQIRRQEQELHEMLYALYGFSPAEIALIENI